MTDWFYSVEVIFEGAKPSYVSSVLLQKGEVELALATHLFESCFLKSIPSAELVAREVKRYYESKRADIPEIKIVAWQFVKDYPQTKENQDESND